MFHITTRRLRSTYPSWAELLKRYDQLTKKDLPTHPAANKLLRALPTPPSDDQFLLAIAPGQPNPNTDVYDPVSDYRALAAQNITGKHPINWAQLRQIANAHDVTIALPYREPSSEEAIKALTFLSGANVHFTSGAPPAMPKELEGVVLHPGRSGLSALHVMGRATPDILPLHGSLDKYTEYLLLESVWPGLMPHTQPFVLDEAKAQVFAEQVRLDIAAQRFNLPTLDWQGLIQHITECFAAFPREMIIKPVLGCMSGDRESLIRTRKTYPAQMVNHFCETIWSLGLELAKEGPVTEQRIAAALLQKNNTAASVIFDALLNRDKVKVIAQEFLELEKVAGNWVNEWRVDVKWGRVFLVTPRYTCRQSERDENLVKRTVNEFFRRAAKVSPEYAKLSGGWDVAFVQENGKRRVKVIETNPGTDSGCGSGFGRGLNKQVYHVTGKPTPYTCWLRKLYRLPNAAQAQVIGGLHSTLFGHRNLPNDAHKLEIAIDVGRNYLNKAFDKQMVNAATIKTILRHLRNLVKSLEEKNKYLFIMGMLSLVIEKTRDPYVKRFCEKAQKRAMRLAQK